VITTLGHIAAEHAADPAEAPRPGDTARARLLVSAISLAALATGVAGLLTGAGVLRAAGMVAYLLFGLGAAPWALSRRMGLAQRLAFTGGGSLAILILVSVVMLLGHVWHPMIFATMACVLTAPLHVAGVTAAVRELPPRATTPRHAPPRALLLSITGAALCGIAALTHRHIEPGLWGFLVKIGPLWYVGLLLIVASLALARSADEVSLAVGVLLLMLVLTGTPALVYDGPRIQSAAKHLEFVQQIRDTHQLRSTVVLYNDWPGYFSAMAWLSDVAGIRDPLGLATAWPAIIGVARVFAMRYLAGQLLDGKTMPWLAAGLGVLADPLGQNYFSPQSVGFVLGLMIFGVALSAVRPALKTTILILLGSTVTVTHQLSPYVICGTLCILVVFRRLRPWWTPTTVLMPALIWTFLHRDDVGHFFSLGDFGNVSNFQPPSTAATAGLHRLPVVTATVVALVAGVVLLGVVAFATLIRGRRRAHIWAVAMAPAAGFAIVAINPYGNEGLFRALLFGLPWLAVLAAAALPRNDARPLHWPLAGLALPLCLTFLVATFGLDASNVLRPTDRAAFQIFLTTPVRATQTNFLLVLGPGDLPSSPPTPDHSYVAVKRSDIDPDGFAIGGASAAAYVPRITGEFVEYAAANASGSHLYAFWSPVSLYYGWEYGMHDPAQFATLRDSFVASSSWTIAYSSGGTVLFEYTGA
jgi:hypothetical protein